MKILRSPLFYGILIALLTLGISVVMNQSFAFKLSSKIGGGFLFLAVIFSGSLNSGDRMRANYIRESKEEREERFHLTGIFIKLGLPSIALCIVLYLLR